MLTVTRNSEIFESLKIGEYKYRFVELLKQLAKVYRNEQKEIDFSTGVYFEFNKTLLN